MVLGALILAAPNAATSAERDAIELKVRPRICSLSAENEFCETVVSAQWRSERDESLCLVVVGRPEIKRCWERYSKGVYSVALAFRDDLLIELRDPELRTVLAQQAVKVIREALLLRRKRRQPWSIF